MNQNTKRISLTHNPIKLLDVDFLEAQKTFFKKFRQNGFQELFNEINPINDYTDSNWSLSFENVEWGEPRRSFRDAQRLGLTYDAPVYVTVRLLNKRSGEIKKQKLFVCDMPIMSERASFMVNGNERVVVFQILRSEGILFSEAKNSSPSRRLYSVKLMPSRGKWYEFEMNKYGVLSVKLLEKRPRVLLTTLLRAFGFSSDEEIQNVLGPVDTGEVSFIENTLRKDVAKNTEEALIDIYRKLRPEDAVTLDNAREFLNNIFFNIRKFHLGRVGRYKLSKKLGLKFDPESTEYGLTKTDLVEVIKSLIKLNNGQMPPDDIDSLSNRRIRGLDELVAERLRAGILVMEKNIRDKMSTHSTEENVTPAMLVNTRPIMSAINQFFGSSALLRFMDQENILSELEVKRKISAGGPRGLTKERATFSVRDVHNSHYSKLCPVTTPEGPSVGMVNQLAIYTKINEYGFLEAPYYRVVTSFHIEKDVLKKFQNRYVSEDVYNDKKLIIKKESLLTEKIIETAKKANLADIPLVPFVNRKETIYLDAEEELEHKIASASIQTDEHNNITEDKTYIRDGNTYSKVPTSVIDLVDITPSQIAGLGLALIPFAGNDDPNRTLIGAKTQNQAIPLVKCEPPIVGTGFEKAAVRASGRSTYAEDAGIVLEADGKEILIEYTGDDGKKYKRHYEVEKFTRTNQNTSFSQSLRVLPGTKVKKDDLLIDGPCTINGELALGTNLRTAFIVFDGYNYEDGLVISERLIKEDLLTSIHIKEYTQEIRETKLGDEELTRDIPGAGEHALRHLDEDGLVRIGARVEPGDVLAGIIAPKGEKELTAEEKLLRALFGDYARDVRDNSLKVPYGEHGVIIAVQVLDKSKGAKLTSGVIKQVKIWVAKTHKVSVGDKLTGFHGDKGVITKVVPEEDMPYTDDGKPVDIIVGPTSMVRRMNLGMLIEAHIAGLAKELNVRAEVQPFSKYSIDPLIKLAKEKKVEFNHKVDLYDGRTGRKFDQKVTVGMKYFFKLDHLADHKVHARSTGPYTLVTQQPLRGKAQRGGRRFGEMEVWALEAHAVPTALHEMLTIKSDDVVGRAAAYKSITTGREFLTPNIPESFNVLDKELAGLAIKLEKIDVEYDNEKEDKALQEIVDSIGEKTSKAKKKLKF